MTSTNDSIQCAFDSMTTGWLKQAQAGDSLAWQRLDRVYRRLVIWWCRKGGIPQQDTEDIVQEVFISVQRGLANYRHESFRGWLWTITKSRINDFLRKQETQLIAPGGVSFDEILNQVEAESRQVVGVTDQATKILFDEVVSMVKGEFSEAHWQAFWMRVVDDRLAAEVAKELGVSRTVVHNATSRIRRRINEEFGAANNISRQLAQINQSRES